jgi:hypothetical protein
LKPAFICAGLPRNVTIPTDRDLHPGQIAIKSNHAMSGKIRKDTSQIRGRTRIPGRKWRLAYGSLRRFCGVDSSRPTCTPFRRVEPTCAQCDVLFEKDYGPAAHAAGFRLGTILHARSLRQSQSEPTSFPRNCRVRAARALRRVSPVTAQGRTVFFTPRKFLRDFFPGAISSFLERNIMRECRTYGRCLRCPLLRGAAPSGARSGSAVRCAGDAASRYASVAP